MNGQTLLEYAIAILIGVLATVLLIRYTGIPLDDDWPRERGIDMRERRK